VKITPSITAVNSGKDAQASKGSRAGGAGKTAVDKGDTIHLSALSSHLHELESSLAAGGEFDAKRVDAIKQAIRDGRFSINTGVVADKLIESAQELIGKKS